MTVNASLFNDHGVLSGLKCFVYREQSLFMTDECELEDSVSLAEREFSIQNKFLSAISFLGAHDLCLKKRLF